MNGRIRCLRRAAIQSRSFRNAVKKGIELVTKVETPGVDLRTRTKHLAATDKARRKSAM